MSEEQKQALIEWLKEGIELREEYGFNGNLLASMRVALAALTAHPVVSPHEWVHIRFTDRSKNQRMKCQIAWSDWLNSVIYDEEGAPLLISNSAFQVIRAAGYQVEGE